jgi:hypothetical protein
MMKKYIVLFLLTDHLLAKRKQFSISRVILQYIKYFGPFISTNPMVQIGNTTQDLW